LVEEAESRSAKEMGQVLHGPRYEVVYANDVVTAAD
jgi:hypothetical protein